MADQSKHSELNLFFRHPVISLSLSALMILGVVLIINPPEALVFKVGVDNAVRVMFVYFLLGFFFLLVGQNRLLFLSFACCAILASFLKSRTDLAVTDLPVAQASSQTFSLVHFNASKLTEAPSRALETVLETSPDIISVQEVNPVWANFLKEELEAEYAYFYSIPDVNLFGFAIYSRLPLSYMDTIQYKGIPIFTGSVELANNKSIDLLGLHTYPAISQADFENIKSHLRVAVDQSVDRINPLLVFGDLALVPWSNEILEFREDLDLMDSRKGLLASYPSGTTSILDIPFDHIFHSKEIQCLYFATINSANTEHLGIVGTYQVK